jgi:hypothetical protein
MPDDPRPDPVDELCQRVQALRERAAAVVEAAKETVARSAELSALARGRRRRFLHGDGRPGDGREAENAAGPVVRAGPCGDRGL